MEHEVKLRDEEPVYRKQFRLAAFSTLGELDEAGSGLTVEEPLQFARLHGTQEG